MVDIFDEKRNNPYFKSKDMIKETSLKKKSKKTLNVNQKKKGKYQIIVKAIEEAQKKYDSMEVIAKKDVIYIQEYIREIINEVKEHTTEDELDGIVIDSEMETFIEMKLTTTFSKNFNLVFHGNKL